MATVKQYNLAGLNANVELGKQGSYIVGSANAVGFYAATDQLQKLSIANAVASNQAITLAQLNAEAGDSVQHITVDVSHTSGAANIATISAGSRILSVTVEIPAAWNAANNTGTFIEVGDTGSGSRFIRSQDVDVLRADQYHSQYQYKYFTEGTLTYSVTAGGATGGNAIISVVLATDYALDTDTDAPSLTFAVAPEANTVNENANITFTIATTNFGSGTLYWTIGGTASNADFVANSGNVLITDNSGTVVITTAADLTIEGNETFFVQLRTDSISGNIVTISSNVTLIAPPTFAVVPAANIVNEGDNVTFTVTTENVANQTLRFLIDSNTSTGLMATTADNFDLIGGVNPFGNRINFALANNMGTFTVPIRQDFLTATGGGGVSWANVAAAEQSEWTSVAYGDDVWVAVAQTGSYRIMRSTNGGQSWSTVAVGGDAENQWQSVAYGDGVWVAVAKTGTYRVMRSTNGGQSWSSVLAALPATWTSVAYGDGVWVAVSFQGNIMRIMRSTNGGVTWTSVAAPEENWFNSWTSVAYGDGVWVAVATSFDPADGPVMRSTDGGVTWSAVVVDETNPAGWTSVAYGDGVWVAVAQSGTNRVMRSTNGGVSWSAVAAAEQSEWTSVAYGDGVWIAVSYTGTNRVMRSSGQRGFHVDITGLSNTTLLVRSEVITIVDTTLTPSITANTTSINEGGSVTFTIDTNNSSDSFSGNSNSTLYYTIGGVTGTINATDFSGNVLPSGAVNIVNHIGTVSVTTRADGLSEGAESFRLQVRTSSTTGTIVANSTPVTINDPVEVEYLIVAGGGAGGGVSSQYGMGAGGGAGGYRTGSQSIGVAAFTVTVGGGGTGIGGSVGGNGSDSVFDTITSTGGGGGARGGVFVLAGNNGGSGGGGHNTGAGGTGNTPSTSPSQGNNGGSGSASAPQYGSGGGGGASAVGANGTGAGGGNGGAGTDSSISGSSVTYAGGGGGASYTVVGGTGGAGGGGNATLRANGVNGSTNRGGGGGGVSNYNDFNTSYAGGNGGSGVVIIAYTTGSMTATGGTVTTSGGNTIHTFTSSGTFTRTA